ncbi:type I restriction enzyme HsdR N-terminal domain-containing protein [Dokdonia sinensis]|uniref:Type I restriction enzyme HsdR N-terminal domain-containing protein n=1 Tax=Dokdonia sinensis TaxID=2479847 RepID=A0A3M0GHW5_9FLAO|nr:type I restriction enzyme HsdR N-terminal domain-containing protein [Dokdonia sinensis]RMB63868.1 type I restriction enzyme HsdR N-terminal domain-containing protein [Dokdonia sinensis]
MQKLAFPPYHFRLKNSENNTLIFDRIRKKFIVLTPEEWVRQHVVNFLVEDKKYPLSLIQVEKEIKLLDTKKRYDIVVFNPDGSIFLIVECKAYSVGINQATFDQIARYNLQLKAQLLMVTNGLNHYYCTMDYEQERYDFLRELPDYERAK